MVPVVPHLPGILRSVGPSPFLGTARLHFVGPAEPFLRLWTWSETSFAAGAPLVRRLLFPFWLRLRKNAGTELTCLSFVFGGSLTRAQANLLLLIVFILAGLRSPSFRNGGGIACLPTLPLPL